MIFESVSIIAKVSPTSTTSSTLNFFSIKMPLTSLGTSLSTLSVEISITDSSTSTLSPISFSHELIVASATLSPIFGSFNSNFAIIFNLLRDCKDATKLIKISDIFNNCKLH